jgi:curli biogenesis system outer membrane secretion channel CsgG
LARSLPACISLCLALQLSTATARVNGQDTNASPRKRVVLVPPFENQTKQREQIQAELLSNNPDKPRRAYMVDRYTEAPRSLLENVLTNIDGISIVERQRVDTLLAEGEFGDKSGLVDAEKAIKLGKLVGANAIVIGTLTDIRDDTKSFKGYGVETENMVVTCQMRVRLLDIESGKLLFSKVVKGSKTYTKSTFGQSKSSDRNFAAIEAAIDNLGEDIAFRAAVQGKGKRETADTASADGMVEVDFSPKPDNCDIEIDGKYVGGSPLKRRLKAGNEYRIRISKGGYMDWTGVITAEAGLRITRELGPNP